MHIDVHTIPKPLDSHIESIFHIKDFVPDHSIERVVPTGHVYIIFELDGMIRNTFDNETLKSNGTFAKVWVSGTHRNYMSISAHPQSEMFVIQFKPYGAYPFVHTSVDMLNEKVLPGVEVFGDEILDLRERILEKPNSLEKFHVAEDWLKKRFKADLVPPKELQSFYHQIQNEPSTTFLEASEEYPNSQKHLIDQFKKYVGLPPKYSQRILRFNEILQKIKREEKISWAQIAYECGFTDQSYFIKEFKHFSGFNPQEFIKQDFEQDENFFPLDREG
ncbi:MAG: AraC family transcriptional regulator [Cyclobacteriaceae bacterium]